ncbi:MAG: MBL fold metallo-hydrolase [Candidatus Lokiarchaeota archaeon]|nr:MBL fold metallo-hydrolase [Candidatus Lokiarchaeota archaeon]MBD3337588.1 MBL fold metallo-hydrolase [Candidatus Lokiarchaeota archaeon]
MVFVSSEGKFNDNSYLVDGMIFRLQGQLSLYVIENEGERVMIDAGVKLSARKVVKKLQNWGLFPIHKIILTHSHFDHIQAIGKLESLMKSAEVEVLASANAIDNLKHPEKMNEYFEYDIEPMEYITPLNDGDIVDLNGLELQILDFFGHTHDCIAIFDTKNRNIFVGDAIIDKISPHTMLPEFVPPDFDESAYIKTLRKLKEMEKELDSISLGHFGVWQGEDFRKIVSEVEDFHFDVKNSIIRWYQENPTLDSITLKYYETFIPNSEIYNKENIHGLEFEMQWFIDGLKAIGEIED